MKKIDDYLHAACSTITFATANRKVLIRKTPEELEAHLQKVKDPAYRERQRLSVTQGLSAPHVAQAVRQYDKYFDEMEAALSRQSHLAGDRFSLADAAAIPYVNRAAMLGMDRLWTGRRPNLTAWFLRMQARPSYETAVTKWLSDADRDRFNVPADETWRTVCTILGIR